MAIDDAEKRKAAAAVPIGPGVTPDADQGALWRARAAGAVVSSASGGIAPGPVQSPTAAPVLSVCHSPLAGHPALLGG